MYWICWVVIILATSVITRVYVATKTSHTRLIEVSNLLYHYPDPRILENDLSLIAHSAESLNLDYSIQESYQWSSLPSSILALRPDSAFNSKGQVVVSWRGFFRELVVLSWSKDEGLYLDGYGSQDRSYGEE
jgi:hypothetical protein